MNDKSFDLCTDVLIGFIWTPLALFAVSKAPASPITEGGDELQPTGHKLKHTTVKSINSGLAGSCNTQRLQGLRAGTNFHLLYFQTH